MMIPLLANQDLTPMLFSLRFSHINLGYLRSCLKRGYCSHGFLLVVEIDNAIFQDWKGLEKGGC